jgi:BD-FAE protein
LESSCETTSWDRDGFAVRFIRSRAEQYQIDPNRIGITGGSAGGHLSLMQGTAGTMGKPDAKDPVDRPSSRVQAVACFFPPTDFLNYGKPGENALGRGVLKNFRAPFDFQELDAATKAFVPIAVPFSRRNSSSRSSKQRASPRNLSSRKEPPTAGPSSAKTPRSSPTGSTSTSPRSDYTSRGMT